MAFRTTASQFLLPVSIHKHLLTYENIDQNFVEKFLANLYVDNNINKDDCYEKTFELYKKNVACMKDAGFELRKFHTNDPDLQTTINKLENFQSLEANLKVSGIGWHKLNDSFIIYLNKIYEAGIELPTTKRNILKIIASIYDPIGIISPVVVLFKILFQNILLLKCEWDSDLNLRLSSQWKKLFNSIKEITFTVTRFYFQLFLIYMHFQMLVNMLMPLLFTYPMVNRVYLVISKTKVAPIQPVSIPQLALLLRLLLAKSVEIVLKSLRILLTFRNNICWSDSLDALHWIKGAHPKWKLFIQNNVEKIRKLTNVNIWRHCPGNLNPASLPWDNCN